MSKYIKDEELWKEIKISKGMGKRTRRLEELLVVVVDNVVRKKNKFTPYDLREDIKQEALLVVLNKWSGFNCDKYDTALPYVTEVTKRAQTNAFNSLCLRKKNYHEEAPVFYSLSNIYSK